MMVFLKQALRSFLSASGAQARYGLVNLSLKHPRSAFTRLSEKKEARLRHNKRSEFKRLSGLKNLSLLAITAITLTTALPSSSNAQDITTGLVGHWTLDETTGTNVVDQSGRGNNGTWASDDSATDVKTTAGIIGSAVSFDGIDDGIYLGQNPDFDFSVTNAFTISAWVRPSGGAGESVFSRGLANTGPTGVVYSLFRNPSNRWEIEIGDGTAAIGAVDNGTTNNTISLNEWQHITATWDGTDLILYKNGEPGPINNSPGFTMWDHTNVARRETAIGASSRNYPVPGDEFEGDIDEVRVYNRALTAIDVQTLYSQTGARTGYFVMIGNQPTNAEANEFDGDLGGLEGANATCLSYLQTHDWRGKDIAEANGMLTPSNVRAWLCDDNGCQDMRPNTQYSFAKTEAGEEDTGGASFTTDSNGYFPTSNTDAWDEDNYLSRNTRYWTGRASDFSPSPGNTCNNWTDNSGGANDGSSGESVRTDSGRWDRNDLGCDTTDQFICFVNPVTPQDLCNATQAGKIIFEESTRVMKYCDGASWISMGKEASILHGQKTRGEDYTPNAVEFDGSTYLNGANPFPTNSKRYTGSFWIKINEVDGALVDISNNQGAWPRIYRQGGGDNRFRFRSNSVDINSNTSSLLGGSWNHVLYSFDASDPTKRHIYINDIDEFGGAITYIDAAIDSSSGGPYFLGGRDFANTNAYEIADWWMDSGTYIDFSIEANRRKFIDENGRAVNLGTDGSRPTGRTPDIFLSGDTATWHTNDGSATGFTENGALTDASTSPSGTTAEKLIGWWKLDETSGTTAFDSSGEGNDATLQGGIDFETSSVEGPVGRALEFRDADGSASTATAGSISPGLNRSSNNTFTYTGWIKRNNPQTGSGNRRIFGNLSDVELRMGSTSMTLDFGTGTDLTTSTTLESGVWYHYAITHNAFTHEYALYVNGVLEDSATDPTTVFGQLPREINWPFSGLEGPQDDIRIYNYVLSIEEIQELYNASNVFYQPNAVDFDGTATYLEGPVTPIGVNDGNQGTASFWFKLDGNGSDMTFMRNATARIIAEFDASNGGQIRFWGEDSSNTTLLNMGSDNFNGDITSWHHVMASWDLSDPSRRHIYINGVSDLDAVNYTTHVDGAIQYSNGYYRIGANALGSNMLDGQVADFWFDSGTYIDLSIEGNRRKFLDENGNARFLGTNGELVTGTAPDIYLSGDTATWHTNDGASGGFTENGALTDAANEPSGEKQPRYCTSPSLPEGTLIYNSNDHVMQYCDGFRYIALGPQGDGGSGCSNPTGSSGSLIFNETFNTLQYCEGDQWVGIGSDPTVSILAQGLIGYWPLDESGNISITADASGNGNNGNLTSFAADPSANWVSGVRNNALDFDGIDDYVDLGASTLFDNLGPSTYCAWVNPQSFGGNNQGRIIDLSVPGTSYTMLHLKDDGANTNTFRFYKRYGTTALEVHAVPNTLVPSAFLNSWSHLCATWSGGSSASDVKLFYNGFEVVQDDTTDGTGGLIDDSSGNFTIGSRGTTVAFDGQIDDVRIYNRALSANEVQQLFASSTNTQNVGLLGYWRLDETSGTNIVDSSGNGYDGTVDTAVSPTSGVVSGALGFNFAEDEISISDNAFDNMPILSTCAWIKPNLPGSGTFMEIINKSPDGNSNGWQFYSHRARGYLAFYNSAGDIFQTVDGVLSDDTWHHVCATWDGRNASDSSVVYLDGNVVATTYSDNPPSGDDSANDLMIGSAVNGAFDWDGEIDEVRIYNRVLSASEVQAFYNAADCPNIGDVCSDGSVYAGNIDYGSGNEKFFVSYSNDVNGIVWKNSTGLDDITPDSNTDGRANQNNRSGVITDFPAFEHCENLSVHGHTDWYLPSRDEVLEMCSNKVAIAASGAASVSTGNRWASTEIDANSARRIDMNNCISGSYGKTVNTIRTRCIRRD